ncbi:hypothetical protein A0H81_05690 [Grifola frondosa]|uniref:Uncharacterized protein n=1 Tax=Grifola frondosa TaxID=5627 RepID=A0A1C7MDS0_GRIFR|nr:hypothetical protein A0H81_05690 [Grifola frondosa]
MFHDTIVLLKPVPGGRSGRQPSRRLHHFVAKVGRCECARDLVLEQMRSKSKLDSSVRLRDCMIVQRLRIGPRARPTGLRFLAVYVDARDEKQERDSSAGGGAPDTDDGGTEQSTSGTYDAQFSIAKPTLQGQEGARTYRAPLEESCCDRGHDYARAAITKKRRQEDVPGVGRSSMGDYPERRYGHRRTTPEVLVHISWCHGNPANASTSSHSSRGKFPFSAPILDTGIGEAKQLQPLIRAGYLEESSNRMPDRWNHRRPTPRPNLGWATYKHESSCGL